MSFNSLTFFVFFAIVLFFLMCTNIKGLNNRRLRHWLLLFSSYVFYGFWDWRFCFLMLLMTAIAYFCAIKIAKGANAKFYRNLGVVFPLIVLAVFKYFNFFIQSFQDIFNVKSIGALNIILPVGISFYTFHSLSYTIDVWRGKIPAVKAFEKVALYISFFPQLIAGPIVKASEFLPQLDEERNITIRNFAAGIQVFLFGAFKKVVIADYLSVFVDDVFRVPAAYNALTVILAVVSYSVQIYFDFSGYSDMAVGCAKIMGYDLPRNFNMPYISKNLSEFWKRWHISLSTWLMQYLYIPLGGNKKGKARTYINLMLTMVLGGLWHGANWTFIFWGFLHGAGLCVHKLWLGRSTGKNTNFIVKGMSIFFTYIFVCFCWVFFRAQTISGAFSILGRLSAWDNGIIQIYSWAVIAIILLIAATIVAVLNQKRTDEKPSVTDINAFYPILDLTGVVPLTIVIFVAGLTFGLAYTGVNPFIYFQF